MSERADELDEEADADSDDEGGEQPFPRRVLELLAADVPEQRGVGSPQRGGDDVGDDEPAPRHRLQVTARERDGRSSTGDEAGDDDQVEAARLELPLGPLEGAPALGAAEQAL